MDDNKVKQAEEFFYKLLKPKVYWGEDGEEVRSDIGFETSCVILGQRVPAIYPKGMTVMEFYITLGELKKQHEAEKQALKKHGRG